MSESPEVLAALPPAVKRLMTVRSTLTRERARTCSDVAEARRKLRFYENRLSEIDSERNDIDRAIQALSYPNADGGIPAS